MRTLALFMAALLLPLMSCRQDAAGIAEEMDVAQAEELMRRSPDLQIIDVRSPGEHKAGYIKGAKLIPIDEFEGRFKEVDKDKPALLYCAGGGRSGVALGILKKNGYQKATHLAPGFDAWKGAGKPFEK